MAHAAIRVPTQTMVEAALIVETTASHFALSVLDLRSERKTHSLGIARHVATVLMLEHTILCDAEIGQALGRTKGGGAQLVASARKRLGDDQTFKQLVEQVRQRLTDGGGHD